MNKPSMTKRPLPPPPRPKAELNEKRRIYHYANGTQIILNNVTELMIRPSGDHRLIADGKIWVIAPGWMAIEIDKKECTSNE